MGSPSSAGGAAAAGGTNFEARVAAWYAVHMLGEAAAPSVPGRGSDVRVTTVWCQTDEPVDDILIGYSDGGWDFVQAKRSLRLQEGEESDLAKALDQCVRQFVTARHATALSPGNRVLDVARDRLVLAVGPTASESIRINLRAVLKRARALDPTEPLLHALKNKQDEQVFAVVKEHLGRSWKRAAGEELTDSNLRLTMRLLSVFELSLDDQGAHMLEVRGLLRHAVIVARRTMSPPGSSSVALPRDSRKSVAVSAAQISRRCFAERTSRCVIIHAPNGARS